MYKVFYSILFVCLSAFHLHAQQKEYSFLFLGDIFTKGSSAEENYPMLLIRELKNEGLYIKNARVLAQNGWTSGQLMDTLLNDQDYTKYDYVFLCIGIHNLVANKEINLYKKDIVTLLNYASMFSANKPGNVYMISIPDYNWGTVKTDKMQSSQIDLYNEVNKTEADKAGANYINITDISRASVSSVTNNTGQYTLWAKQIAPVLLKNVRANK